MQTKLMIFSPIENNKLYEGDVEIQNVKPSTLNSWELAEYCNVIEQRINNYILKSGAPIGGGQLDEYLMIHVEQGYHPTGTKRMNVIDNNRVWDTKRDGEKVIISKDGDTLILTHKKRRETFSRINGVGMDSIWLSDFNEIMITKNNLNLEVEFIGNKLYYKSLSFSLFSNEVLNSLDSYVRRKNDNEKGWKFITTHVLPTVRYFLNHNKRFTSNRFESTKGWKEAGAYVEGLLG